MTPESSPQRKLIPDALTHPLILIWTCLLPQIILIFLNLHTFWLAREKIVENNHLTDAYQVFALELAVLSTATIFTGIFHVRKKVLSPISLIVLLGLHFAYLWMVTASLDALLGGIEAWIIGPERVIFHQFVLMMPGLFFAAFSLASFSTKISARADGFWSLLTTVSIPVLWYLMLQLERFFLFSHVKEWILLFLGVLSTLICVMAFIRFLTLMWNWLSTKGHTAVLVLTCVITLVAPLGGLILNRTIPFPTDLQSPAIYILTILNGLILLLPCRENRCANRAVWLAQCFCLPFSLYFFLVFLPFLPLSLVAMLAAGAGFLILAPTGLFMIHLHRLIQGFRREVQGFSPRKLLLMGCLAGALLPVYFLIQPFPDRNTLHQALDYVYAPNHREPQPFSGSLSSLKRTLRHLQEFKANVEMPLLSAYYESVVFGGLTLPDPKINHLHCVFFGKDIEPLKTKDSMGIFWGRGRGALREDRRISTNAFPQAKLDNLQIQNQSEAGCDRSLVKLTLSNPGDFPAEFVTDIHLPAGVFVSGYSLTIGKERVPGRIFEKKSAMWIYQMIRSYRRDPGLLVYTGVDTVQLRVFPVAKGEVRTTEVEFLYPSSSGPTLNLGTRSVPLGQTLGNDSLCWAPTSPHSGMLIIPAGVTQKLPTVTRKPYFHFLIDRSATSHGKQEDWGTLIRKVAEKFPNIADCRISEGNFEWRDVVTPPTPLESALEVFSKSSPPSNRGGFCPERAIKHALLDFRNGFENSHSSPWDLRYPVFVLIHSTETRVIHEENFEWFANEIPETSGWLIDAAGNEIVLGDFSGRTRGEPASLSFSPVHLWRVGETIRATLPSVSEPRSVMIEQGSVEDLAYFDSSTRQFQKIQNVTSLPSESPYSKGVQAWALHTRSLEQPSTASNDNQETVALSKESGILTPVTSYIVVESAAQWKALEEKERQKLKNRDSLEIMESPEPPLKWVVLLLALAWMIRRLFFKKFHHIPNISKA